MQTAAHSAVAIGNLTGAQGAPTADAKYRMWLSLYETVQLSGGVWPEIAFDVPFKVA
ncbi:MAG TPA: hypothetical protein VIY90_18660 [Steroidobacteraceae bacterium]